MAVTIRLSRTGCNNAPSYRVMVADTRAPRDGRFIEIVGSYDPKRKGENYTLDLERIDYWLGQGAKASETVASLVKRARKAAPAAAEA
ncbi:MAG: 30S ribosomal protein S16 [Lentisphaerae bacterium]|jgi:small subunit ribosomal protein S16|nr:30S ribosomal protein S16 [Lentisphaerota bacterium]